TTLMPMLRAVENLWRLDKQEKNAEAIADRAGTLYDKFVGVVGDLDKVSRNLEAVNKSFADARNKLTDGRGNLVRQAEMLRSMGANTSKRTPQKWRNEAQLGADRAAAVGKLAATDDEPVDDDREASDED